MLCLGWQTQNNCKASDPVAIADPVATQTQSGAVVACPSANWFWLSLAGILGYGLIKK